MWARSSSFCPMLIICPPGTGSGQAGLLARRSRMPPTRRPPMLTRRRWLTCRLAGANVSDHRRQRCAQVRDTRPALNSTSKATSAQSSTPKTASSCATTTTCSARDIHQASMEAGERWMLNDAAGKPIYAWDSRDHQFRHSLRSFASAHC